MTASWRGDKRTSAERGYGGKWQRERLIFLGKHPLCERCQAIGRTTAATVVNHRIPHKGDWKLFWDRKNWEPSCQPHHDRDIKKEEMTGIRKGVTDKGRPIDPNHPWNRSDQSVDR